MPWKSLETIRMYFFVQKMQTLCIKLLMEFFKGEKVHQPKGNLNSAKIWAYVIKASCLFHFFSLQSLGLFQPLLNCGFSRITFRIYLLWVLFSFLTWNIINMLLISRAFNQISLLHLWEQNTEKKWILNGDK